MARATEQKVFSYTLHLTEQEAVYLKALMGHPVFHSGATKELCKETRTDIYHALNNAGVK